jgi:hypothetical protein
MSMDFALPSLFAAGGKRRGLTKARESFDLHEIATACENFAPARLLPLSAMDRPGALL